MMQFGRIVLSLRLQIGTAVQQRFFFNRRDMALFQVRYVDDDCDYVNDDGSDDDMLMQLLVLFLIDNGDSDDDDEDAAFATQCG